MKLADRFVVQKGWKLLMVDMGINPAHVLIQAGLPTDLFTRKEASLSPTEYFRLWQGLEQLAGSQLPLLIGQTLSVEAFDPPVFACLCSPNLNMALQRLASYKRLICPMVLAVAVDREKTSVTLSCEGFTGQIPSSFAMVELVFFTQLARLATRQRIIPRSLELLELPSDCGPYEAWFGAPLRVGSAIRIQFSAADGFAPFLTEDAALWDFFEAGLKKKLSDQDAAASISQRVKSALLELLPGGKTTIDDVAGRLAMSKRSLQRYLGNESLSFQEILSQTRRELAHHYLARSSISPAEISFLLGFRDSNSFLRAFKDWTGSTPGAYRNRQQSGLEQVG